MSPPLLNPTHRYYPHGIRKTYWLVATANYFSPTRAEMNAGIDLSAEVESMSGFSLAANMVEVPDMGSRFISQIPGALTSPKNQIVYYQDQQSDDIRQIHTNGQTGFIVVLWDGDVSGQLMDVFPVIVAAIAPDSDISKAGMITVDYAASLVPAINVVIPAG